MTREEEEEEDEDEEDAEARGMASTEVPLVELGDIMIGSLLWFTCKVVLVLLPLLLGLLLLLVELEELAAFALLCSLSLVLLQVATTKKERENA